MENMVGNNDLEKTRAERREARRRMKMRVHGSGMKKLAGKLSSRPAGAGNGKG